MRASVLRVWAVTQKEFVHLWRDWRTLVVQIVLPIVQLFLFGYAINTNVDHVPTVVADQAMDGASRAYLDAMVQSGSFDVVAYVADQAAVVEAIDRGSAKAGVVIPPGFAQRVERGDARVLVLVDGADFFTAQAAYNAALLISQAHTTEVMVKRVSRLGRPVDVESLLPLQVRVRILYNPRLSDLWFIIPSMVASIIQTQTVALTAAAVVREREVGTIEQILVTPIRSLELILGKLFPNMVLSLLNMGTILAVGVFWFGVPFRGSWGAFALLSLLYVFSGLGLGLLISTVAQNQRQAQQMLMPVMLLSLVLSGFIFPRYTMPPVLRWLGDLFPLTYFIPIARGVITKGAGVEVYADQVVALGVYVVVLMVVATRAFRRRLD